jgi:hypothetical protein
MQAQLPLLSAAAAGGAMPEMGVYVGIQQMEYAGLAAPHLQSFGPYNASGSPFSVAAGRLSFTYGLKGEQAVLMPSASAAETICKSTRGRLPQESTRNY